MAKETFPRARRPGWGRPQGRPVQPRLRAASQLIEVGAAQPRSETGIEGAQVIEDVMGELCFVPGAAIRVRAARVEGEALHEVEGVFRSPIRWDPSEATASQQAQSDLVAAAQMAPHDGGRFVQREIEGRSPWGASPPFHRCVHEHPDEIAFLDLVLRDQELPATGGSLPRDATERVSWTVLP